MKFLRLSVEFEYSSLLTENSYLSRQYGIKSKLGLKIPNRLKRLRG